MSDDLNGNRNSGTTTDVRDAKGRFVFGNPGRPVGTRHKITKAIEALLEGDAERLTRQAIDQALRGDTTAMRLCLERILPPSRSRPVEVDLPEINTAADGLVAINAVIRAAACGDITLDEAQTLVGMIESHRKALEMVAIEERLSQLEQAVAKP